MKFCDECGGEDGEHNADCPSKRKSVQPTTAQLIAAYDAQKANMERSHVAASGRETSASGHEPSNVLPNKCQSCGWLDGKHDASCIVLKNELARTAASKGWTTTPAVPVVSTDAMLAEAVKQAVMTLNKALALSAEAGLLVHLSTQRAEIYGSVARVEIAVQITKPL